MLGSGSWALRSEGLGLLLGLYGLDGLGFRAAGLGFSRIWGVLKLLSESSPFLTGADFRSMA